MSNLSSALEQLIREPCGCFEQTSSTVYPLAMAQKYFKTHTGVDPKLISLQSIIIILSYCNNSFLINNTKKEQTQY